MRELETTLAAKTIKLAANFKAADKIAKKVADPMLIAREALLEYMMLEKGIAYQPKWMFTVENLPVILHIGAEAAGEKISLEEMQNLVFEHGFSEAKAVAVEYLGLIMGPRPEESVAEGKSEGN